MSQYRKKSNRRDDGAGIVGDLFRVILAVSLLIAAIVAAFLLVKYVSGFSLPDLKDKQTTTAAPVIITEAPKETPKKTEVSIAQTTAAPTVESTVESTAESVEEPGKSTEDSSSNREVNESSRGSEVIGEAPTEAETVREPGADPNTTVIGPGEEISAKGPEG